MNNYFWLILSIIWAGLIVYLSFFNPLSEDNVESWFKNQDKLGHFVFYALLSLGLCKTFSQEIIIQNPLIINAMVALIFGVLIELSQHFFTYDRDGNFWDALANGLGILFMLVLINSHPKLFGFNPKT
jgi:VanZ family protein